jgi:hypothetical protein
MKTQAQVLKTLLIFNPVVLDTIYQKENPIPELLKTISA